jgi:hypothetical protein
MMSVPMAIGTIRWMVWDTYRQSISSHLIWLISGIHIISIVLCLSVAVAADEATPEHPFQLPLYLPAGVDTDAARAEGIRIASGEMSLGFGLIRFPLRKSTADAVHWLQIWLAGILADTVGVLLALLWTAAFIPQFLEPSSISILLAKPVSRWLLIVSKYFGVIIFVCIHAIIFTIGTWTALGIRTGIWDMRYFFAAPLLVVNFSVFYGFSVLLALCSRGHAVPLFGTLLFWILCWAMNWTRHYMLMSDMGSYTPLTHLLIETGYWVLPKPLDMSGLFYEFLHAGEVAAPVPEWEQAWRCGAVSGELAVLSSLVFGGVMVGLAAYEFQRLDY